MPKYVTCGVLDVCPRAYATGAILFNPRALLMDEFLWNLEFRQTKILTSAIPPDTAASGIPVKQK